MRTSKLRQESDEDEVQISDVSDYCLAGFTDSSSKFRFSSTASMDGTFPPASVDSISEDLKNQRLEKDNHVSDGIRNSANSDIIAPNRANLKLEELKSLRSPLSANVIGIKVLHSCYTRVSPSAEVDNPQLVAWSDSVAELLDLDAREFERPDFPQIFSGASPLSGGMSYAQCYGGHQFGIWAGQLGDGRAITLGELVNSSGHRWELQLKGAGKTPYSRFADGLAVLRSSIRDGNPKDEPGAIVCRVAPSFLLFGSYQIHASRGKEDLGLVRTLADYTIRHHFPHLENLSKSGSLSFSTGEGDDSVVDLTSNKYAGKQKGQTIIKEPEPEPGILSWRTIESVIASDAKSHRKLVDVMIAGICNYFIKICPFLVKTLKLGLCCEVNCFRRYILSQRCLLLSNCLFPLLIPLESSFSLLQIMLDSSQFDLQIVNLFEQREEIDEIEERQREEIDEIEERPREEIDEIEERQTT
ncbi:hypothetical protein SASPL_118982 [Salvia splendens]|uniref:Selenoprotein O n=1 Tax=Salvia splendens TaxID=180675 RepID=A0A8X8ZZM6_SALSN|nr:hypothetical protein SASPL_118982 [Salvia splendens]